jgi:hypothetical protein
LIIAEQPTNKHSQNSIHTKYSSAMFGYSSHRRVWVDWRIGAAVMWSPSYHDVWAVRYREVQALRSLEDALIYAKKNSINYLIDNCTNGSNHTSVYKAETMCVYSPVSSN